MSYNIDSGYDYTNGDGFGADYEEFPEDYITDEYEYLDEDDTEGIQPDFDMRSILQSDTENRGNAMPFETRQKKPSGEDTGSSHGSSSEQGNGDANVIVYKDDGRGEKPMFDEESFGEDAFDPEDFADGPSITTSGLDALTFEEQMEEYATNIFGTLLSGTGDLKNLMALFKSGTPAEMYRDENFIIAKVLQRTMSTKILTSKRFRTVLCGQIGKLNNYDPTYIHLGDYNDVGGSKERGFIEAAVQRYESYLHLKPLKEDEFSDELKMYRLLFGTVAYSRLLKTSQEMLTTGVRIRNQKVTGPENVSIYLKKNIAEISGLMEIQKGKGFVPMEDDLSDDEDTIKERSELLYDFPTIPTLKEHIGGIYKGDFIQVMAPPKQGKTKLCQRICYEMVMSGHNVTVWPVEGGHEAWSASMRCMHCDRFYNKNSSVAKRRNNLPTAADILKNRIKPEVVALEKESKADLRDTEEYGRVEYIDQPFKLESFLDAIETSIQSNGSSAVFIDYMQLISSDTSREANHQIISQAYQDLLQFCRHRNVAVVTPVQFKQEVVAQLANDGKDTKQDMRVAASGSSQVIRTPDYTLVLYGSITDLQNGVAVLKSMPNRFSQAIPDIPLDTDLGYNIFAEARV